MSIRFACRSPRVRTLLYAVAALFLLFGPGLRAAAAQVSTVVGTGEDGSLYAIDMPAQWNGELVVYAHGIVDPDAPVALPTTQDGSDLLRARITGMGYAIAYSSFSDNGYSLKSAIQRTHQLRGAFATTFGQPGRTYLVGHSLGGLAVLALAETYPGQYAGALPMCSPVGGGTAEIQYLGNGRVLFDYFFPSAVPGGPFTVPQGTSFAPGSPAFNAALGALVGGLSAPGQPTLQFASAAKLPFRSVPELINSGMSVVGFSVRFTNDVLDRTSGHIPYENRRDPLQRIGKRRGTQCRGGALRGHARRSELFQELLHAHRRPQDPGTHAAHAASIQSRLRPGSRITRRSFSGAGASALARAAFGHELRSLQHQHE